MAARIVAQPEPSDRSTEYERGWADGQAAGLDASQPVINALQQALRVARHSPHDQAGNPVEGFPVCSACGAIQTAAQPECVHCGMTAGDPTGCSHFCTIPNHPYDAHGAET